jgi:hypothetical protein
LSFNVVVIVFGCVLVIYVVLGFAMAILASQMMALLQDNEIAARLEKQSKPRVRWYGVHSIMGYHPLNPRLWFDIVMAPDLPQHALNKQRQMRVVFAAETAAFICLGALVLAF